MVRLSAALLDLDARGAVAQRVIPAPTSLIIPRVPLRHRSYVGQVGGSFGVTRWLAVQPSVPLVKPGAVSEPRPTKVESSARSAAFDDPAQDLETGH